MAGGSADIGIRVFLDDAASQALGSINSGLARMVSTTQTASRAMGGLSGAMAGVGVAVGFAVALLAFGAAIKYSVDQASLFQQAMFGVAIATHVPMGVAMQYSNTLMNLAASSIYTSAQIADGIVQMGRAGYPIHDIFTQMAQAGAGFVNVGGRMVPIMSSMAQAGIALGIATRSTAVQGFTMLTQAMVAYQAPADQALHFANILQFAFEHQRGSVSELTSALGQVLPVAGQLGVPFREIAAALDVVGPIMKSTSSAGVALRYTLQGLYTPTNPAKAEMIALGLAAVDASGHFHSAFYDARGNAIDFDAALHLLAQHLQGLSQEDRLAALKNLFSIKGGQGADILLGNLSKLDAYLRQLQGSSDNAGGAMLRWNQVMNTLGGAMAGLKSSVTDLAVVIGGQFLPVLTNIANQANGFVSHIRSMASANPAATGSFLKLGAAMSGVGLVATIVALVFFEIGTGILAFIGIVAGVAAAVVLLTIGIMLVVNWFRNLYNSSSAVRNAVGALGQMFNELGASVGQAVAMAFSTVQQVLAQTHFKITDLLPALNALLVILGIVAAIIIGVVVGALRGLIMALAMFAAGLILVLAGVGQFISGVVLLFTGLVNVISGLLKGNTDQVNRGFAQMRDGVMNIIRGLVTAILGVFVAVFGTIIGFVVGFVQGIISWFHALSSILVGHSIIPDMLNAIRSAFVSGLAAVISFVVNFVSSIINYFINMGAHIIALVVSTWNTFKVTVAAGIAAAVAAVSSGAANMISRIVSFGANVVSTATNAWNNFRNAAVTGINNAVSTVSGGVSRIIGVISGLPGQLYSWGLRAMQSFANGLTSAIGSVTSAVSNAAGQVANFLGHLSPAKMGPLSQDDKWMPNMMRMFASQIESHGPLLQNALNRATGSMALSPQMARIAGPPTAPTGAGGGGGGGSKVVQLVVNGRILGQAVMDDFTTQLQLNGAGRAFR